MSTSSNLRIHLTTFNLALRGGDLSDGDIRTWLAPAFGHKVAAAEGAPDMVVISVQELTALHWTLAGWHGALLQRLSRRMQDALATLSGNRSWSLLHLVNHVGVALWVFVDTRSIGKMDHAKGEKGEVVRLTPASVALGPAGFGNKAAVGLRIVVRRGQSYESFTFVGAHLAAHDSGLAQRNLNYQTILSSLVFQPSASLDEFRQVHHSSHLFLLGDLNYRLARSMPDMMRALEQDENDSSKLAERSALVAIDTLHQEQAKGNAMVGLREGDLRTFAPTYKRILGQVSGWNAKRTPGYTDRILLASHQDSATSGDDDEEQTNETSRLVEVESSSPSGGQGVKVLAYDSIATMTVSDHKPVFAVVSVGQQGGSSIHSTPSIRSVPSTPRADTLLLSLRKISGRILDRIAGYSWLILLAASGGRSPMIGVAVLAVLLIIYGAVFNLRH